MMDFGEVKVLDLGEVKVLDLGEVKILDLGEVKLALDSQCILKKIQVTHL